MAGPGLEELLSILQKSGAPLPGANGVGGATSQDMEQSIPGLSQNVSQTVQGNDTVIPSLRNNYRAQLDQISQMDQKLAQVYGDPSSPLYMNPAQAQRFRSASSNIGYKAASNIGSAEVGRQKELDSQVSDAVSLYSKLTTLQKQEEARAQKATKDEAAISSGKKQYTTDATGQKVLVSTPKGPKSTSQKVSDSIQRSQEFQSQKMQIAGLSDQNAIDIFDNAPAKFRQLWISHMVEGGPNSVPQGGFSAKQVQQNLNDWKKTFGKPSKSSSAGKLFSKGSSQSNTTDYFPQ